MPLRLFNTLTKTKEDFAPIDAKNVRMYVCGPTVYDFAHIGNARPAIVFDLLYRLLRHEYGADHVTYVRNITDVDDKINARALRDFPALPLNDAIRKVTETTEAQYHADVDALGCLRPTHEPRATAHIEGMVTMIQILLDKDHAYVAQGDEGREALFDVRRMEEYGQLSGRKLDDQLAGARIEAKDHKRNPGDFVLWKESNSDEPGWDATFRISDANREQLMLNSKSISIRGRPGWHIECSVMSKAFLGEVFDIHGGGLDLIFPHHENEIAQSRCAHGTPVMANVWMHNGFLQVEGEKMSKSLGNFVTIRQLLTDWAGEAWEGQSLRINMLKRHYRVPIDWTATGLRESRKLFVEWMNEIPDDVNLEARNCPELVNSHVVNALRDDLNTHMAMAEIHDLCKHAARKASNNSQLVLAASMNFLGLLPPVVGSLAAKIKGQAFVRGVALKIDPSEIDALIEARKAAFVAKDFSESDRIRDELLSKGIALKDYKDEAGQRQTSWEPKR